MNEKIVAIKEAVIRHRRKIAVVASIAVIAGAVIAASTAKDQPLLDADQDDLDFIAGTGIYAPTETTV